MPILTEFDAQFLLNAQIYNENTQDIELRANQYAKDIGNLAFNQSERDSFFSLKMSNVCDTKIKTRLINAAFFVDWSCYLAEDDRADYDRLKNVICSFPQGFCIWFCKLDCGRHIAVAYTGWYPIKREIFRVLHEEPSQIKNRGEIRPITADESDKYLWLFNYSIISQLRRSDQSQKMLKSYAADIHQSKASGLSAAILSVESERVATRFNMEYRGNMTHNNTLEKVYTTLISRS